MADLLIILEEKKADIVHALEIKSSLEGKGFHISGMLLRVDGSSLKFIEDLMKIPLSKIEA